VVWTLVILLNIDDIILTASTSLLLTTVTADLSREFAMKDLSPLHHVLDVLLTRSPHSLHLAQHQYNLDLLSRVGMRDCNLVTTPIDTQAKHSSIAGPPVSDPTLYCSLVGALQYVTLTRRDISYDVQQVLHMHDPCEPHLSLIKRILRYFKGTLHHGLTLNSSTSHSLVAYLDVDWAGCLDTRRSTSGFCMYLGDNLISWLSRCQTTVFCSSAEVEYRVVATAVTKSCWVRQLMRSFIVPSRPPLLLL
jgi:hypothetical protein